MAVPNPLEYKYYGASGYLYPYDVRYIASDRAHCNPLSDGRVQFRLAAEHGLADATLIYNDGAVHGAPLHVIGEDRRYRYWEAVVAPANPLVTYTFAFRDPNGKPVYWTRHGIDHSVEVLDRWVLDLNVSAGFDVPAWARGAVIYQIFPERFADGDPGKNPPSTIPWGSPAAWMEFQGGDLRGITQNLDYLKELGVDALYLTPIFVSPSTHKYDTVDYYHVDPGFGGDAALRELVDGLHARKMRLILDASFNHCHPRFFAFRDVLENGEASRYRDWFTIYEFPVRIRYRPHLLKEERSRQYEQYRRWLDAFPDATGIPMLAEESEGPVIEAGYLAWSGVADMPKLNLRNPETRAYFLDVARYWLREFKIDGWRMDVARHVEPDFWGDFRRACKEANPDCYLLAEIWGNTSAWLQGDQFDATMNYIFRDLCVGYFADCSLDTPAFTDGLQRMLAVYSPEVTAVNYNLLSSHDIPRFLHMADGARERLVLATVFQLTFPGAPGLYYGDEIGMTGPGDPGNRGAFLWHQPDDWDRDLLQSVRQLTSLRRAHPSLRHGEWRLVWSGEEALAYERAYEGESVVVLTVRQDGLLRADLPIASTSPRLLWGSGRVSAEDNGIAVEDVPAWSAAIIQV